MEGKSVEDDGDGVLFCVFAYNVQPGVTIDYATGDSSADANATTDSSKTNTKQPSKNTENNNTSQSQTTQGTQNSQDSQNATYIMNTNTHKFHKPGCGSVNTIKEENYAEFTGSREELISAGYEPCKNCNP